MYSKIKHKKRIPALITAILIMSLTVMSVINVSAEENVYTNTYNGQYANMAVSTLTNDYKYHGQYNRTSIDTFKYNNTNYLIANNTLYYGNAFDLVNYDNDGNQISIKTIWYRNKTGVTGYSNYETCQGSFVYDGNIYFMGINHSYSNSLPSWTNDNCTYNVKISINNLIQDTNTNIYNNSNYTNFNYSYPVRCGSKFYIVDNYLYHFQNVNNVIQCIVTDMTNNSSQLIASVSDSVTPNAVDVNKYGNKIYIGTKLYFDISTSAFGTRQYDISSFASNGNGTLIEENIMLYHMYNYEGFYVIDLYSLTYKYITHHSTNAYQVRNPIITDNGIIYGNVFYTPSTYTPPLYYSSEEYQAALSQGQNAQPTKPNLNLFNNTTLTWSASNGANRYRVYRKIDDSEWQDEGDTSELTYSVTAMTEITTPYNVVQYYIYAYEELNGVETEIDNSNVVTYINGTFKSDTNGDTYDDNSYTAGVNSVDITNVIVDTNNDNYDDVSFNAGRENGITYQQNVTSDQGISNFITKTLGAITGSFLYVGSNISIAGVTLLSIIGIIIVGIIAYVALKAIRGG